MNEQRSDLLREIILLTGPGRMALEIGDGPEALKLLSRKHEFILELFGSNGSSTGTSLIDLSQAYHLVGRFKEAREAISKAQEIYQQLDRTDGMLDRLENSMIETCARQGHSFEVERIAKARIARLGEAGGDRQIDKAVTQDHLAKLFIEQQRYEEAIDLIKNSLEIFERELGPDNYETGICYRFLSQAFLQSNQWSEAEEFARKHLACAKTSKGEGSVHAAMSADECSVAIGFSAREEQSAAKAREAIELSEWAVDVFETECGPEAKDTLIGKDNNRRLRLMLSQTVPDAKIADTEDMLGLEPVVVPSKPFISHSYGDQDALETLFNKLPDWCEPIVFEPIMVPPTEFVSDKLISGVLGANGLIFIDSPASRASFWTAFECDLAIRKEKKVYRFDPISQELMPYKVQPPRLWLAHLYHPEDADDVAKIMRWLVDERSFEAFDDDQHPPEDQIPAFSEQDHESRSMFLSSVRSFGAIYILFLSPRLLADASIRQHALEQLAHHPGSTMVCWLESCSGLPPKAERILKEVPKERSFVFSARPSEASFPTHELDDLGVRLFWLVHQGRLDD